MMLTSHHFQVGILKRVLEEVEKVMQEFKGMLYKSMDDPQINLADVCSFPAFILLYYHMQSL